VTFFDPVRLGQDFAITDKLYFVEIGLLVIESMTVENMKLAIDAAWDEGFFSSLRPVG
jgi:hypothetical protein